MDLDQPQETNDLGNSTWFIQAKSQWRVGCHSTRHEEKRQKDIKPNKFTGSEETQEKANHPV
jgi:hypothetical protein